MSAVCGRDFEGGGWDGLGGPGKGAWMVSGQRVKEALKYGEGL